MAGYFCGLPIKRLNIKEFLAGIKENLLLDVRSPGEYNHAHIPGAFSLPLFTDEERKIVGTAYKQQSREIAIKEGLDLFGPKMRKMVEEVESIISRNNYNKKPDIYVYCWRGGMRSAGVAWLLDLYGYKINTLAGGYKAFRNEVLLNFQTDYSFNIIGGYTGSGKTKVLQQLEKEGETIIDLEGLASHKGSAFGGIIMPKQPTQEMFENKLALELKARQEEINKAGGHKNIWLEDESQRIGNCNIPMPLWDNMRNSPVFFLDIPFEERLDYIVSEYSICPVEQLIDAVTRIRKRLGGLDTKNSIMYLEAGNFKEAFSILLRYYDKLYLKGLHNRENPEALVTAIKCPKVSEENARVLSGKKLIL